MMGSGQPGGRPTKPFALWRIAGWRSSTIWCVPASITMKPSISGTALRPNLQLPPEGGVDKDVYKVTAPRPGSPGAVARTGRRITLKARGQLKNGSDQAGSHPTTILAVEKVAPRSVRAGPGLIGGTAPG